MKKKLSRPMRGILLVLMLVSLVSGTTAAQYYFYVQFADKNNSPYSLEQPSEYLSIRALERRQRFGIGIDSTDLPVNPAYVQQVESLGARVHSRSKWMNGMTVIVTDSTQMGQVRALPFVRFVEYTGLANGAAQVKPKKTKATITSDYGSGDNQINQVGGKFLHNLGYRGKGIVVGVIDAGFNRADTNPAFDSLRLQGRLLGTKDIINPESNIYAEDPHGAFVLSIMTGNLPGQFLGTAPDASFWLIRTEYGPTEYKVETDFWCAGIEFADSVGVDVVNSSLGYYTFNDTTMNFRYADMNGKVSRASRAATMASNKGIIVVVSAGNEGIAPWRYIVSPADAEGILTVGAMQNDSLPANFTSYGPSSDGRVKPEVSALGEWTAFVNVSGKPMAGSGTSFSSPVMAGMMACYLQAARQLGQVLSIGNLIQNVCRSASLYGNPSIRLGYGVPNFESATRSLPGFTGTTQVDKSGKFGLFYDPQNKSVHVWLNSRTDTTGKIVQLYNMEGKLVSEKKMTGAITCLDAGNCGTGIYAVHIGGNDTVGTRKILIP
ncbi:MAG TPA: S8 family peptidase [Paludibacter sp.]|nr:S8 family peptidase [Paludibacter sp.]